MNKICSLFKIKYPIIQGGMVWCSGWKLASAVSNCGGLGLLGAGSMHPETLIHHIQKIKSATNKPWGINLPLLYPQMDDLMKIIIDEEVKIVFTSAGSPAKWTGFLKNHGITVVHVVSSSKFARKCEDAGVDAIVAEGFEAGGHNGREETTTMALLPMIKKNTSLPIIAAGGVATGEQMLAAMILGADGVQIGTVFALSEESSAHVSFKKLCLEAQEGDTMLMLKKLNPVRLLKNNFYNKVKEAEERGSNEHELNELLGRGRAKLGMFEGDIEEGELEIGQIAAMIEKIDPVEKIFKNIIISYNQAVNNVILNLRI